jgi:EmrB/QacA subfamily drug resistance transporter
MTTDVVPPPTEPSGADTPEALNGGKHLGLALVVLSAAQLMIVLDATIVNVAIPAIHRGLHFSSGNLEWLITAYALTFGGLLLFGGRTGDLYGKRRMFMTGISLFVVASLLGGLATDDVWLIITRGLQGIGGAIASPTALSLIATNFPEGAPRNRAMGVYAAMSGAGGAVGLLLGGVLTDLVSWRWIFFVNVPIGALVLFLAPRALSESATTPGRLDVPGALSATAGMLSLVYGVSNASEHSWSSLGTLLPIALAVVLLAAFVLIETRSAHPLMPLHIFSNRNRSGAYALMLCISTAVFSMFFFLTQFLQNVRGWSPIGTGLGFLPMTLGIVGAANVVSRLVGRVGVRVPLLIGPAAIVGGLAWLTRLQAHSPYLALGGPLIVISLGLGTSFVPLTLTAVSAVAPEETGLASALQSTTQQVGGALGLAVLATVALSATRRRLAGLATTAHGHISAAATAAATTHGYTTAFEVASGIALAGVCVSLAVIRPTRAALIAAPIADASGSGAEVVGIMAAEGSTT